MRADIYISQTLNISRNKTKELIEAGKILINGEVLDKGSVNLQDNVKIELMDEIYVGRGALKLKHFLQCCKFNIKDKSALDIGSSTGGFMQILLKNGVKSVTGVDVGSNQLDETLRVDSRVSLYENTDIKDFKTNFKFDIITCDVAFISVLQILNYIDLLTCKDALIIILFKPQFEVGKDTKRTKNGVVNDKKAISMAQKKFELECYKLGWMLDSCMESEVKGKEGNAEIFYAFNKR